MMAIVIQEEKNPESSTLDFFGRLGGVEEDRGVRVVCKVILSFCHFVILNMRLTWVKMVEAVMVRSPQIDGTCVF